MQPLRRSILSVIFCVAFAANLFATAPPVQPPTAADLDFFEKKVRPILAERCYSCHSQQSKKLKGHLLLDSPEGWLKGGDTGPAMVAGDPDKSLLIEAVRYKNPDTEMPPKGKLAENEIELLVRWVRMGAPAPHVEVSPATVAKKMDVEAGRKHWAYQPIRHQIVPGVKDAAWPRNEIDRFILASLESKGLHPTADAEPLTLFRRVYFDLTGMPPTPEQIEAYANDSAPNRYEQLVDRLLASPQFGERFGRHWLDVARFGESLTLRGFVLQDAWRYRDYVIESFNQDRPFDHFMQEQIAGDLMPAESIIEKRRQLIGTAFLAIGNTNLEEQDKKQLELDVVDEQIDTMGRAFLGQTIGCARCHDHKFDPIPTADYYALAGILHSTQTLEHSNVSKWLDMPLPMEATLEAPLKKHETAIAVLEEKVKQAKAAQAKAGKSGGNGEGDVPVAGLPGIVIDDPQAKRVGVWKESRTVHPFIGAGYLTDDGNRAENKTLTFMPDIPESGKYEVRFAYTAGGNRASNVPVTVFSADGDETIAIDERIIPPLDGHFISLGQHTFEKNGQGFVIVSNQGVDGHVIADAVQFIPVDTLASLRSATAPGADAAKQAAAPNPVKQLEAELKKLVDSGPKRETVISVRESKKIGDESIHIRGSVHTLGESTPRGFLRVIAMKSAPVIAPTESGRLELAQWLASPENPLPARVAANRVWHWLTGSGIVRTTDNFGTTGESPSHPELLDHLARQLTEHHWSIKTLARQIVLSRVYQLSTTVDAKAIAVDPENRLMSHTNRRRLVAECIRDAMLSVSGQLTAATGGKTFNKDLKSDFGFVQSDRRRSVYLPVFRNALPELFEAFDFADPSVSNGRRNVSTVAPQALFMLNHPFVIEQSKYAARRLLDGTDGGENEARVVRLYRLTLGRSPDEAEQSLALNFLQNANEDRSEAWTQLFHALFASIDFRYVD